MEWIFRIQEGHKIMWVYQLKFGLAVSKVLMDTLKKFMANIIFMVVKVIILKQMLLNFIESKRYKNRKTKMTKSV
jgi:hypothetical protein